MIKSLYPCFQHWSEKGSVYLISDTHFNDKDRILMGYYIDEREQYNILKKILTKNDTLVHLGDVGNPDWLHSLPCYKVLIMGNHDSGQTRWWFDEVYTGPLWISQKLVLSHEPLTLKNWEWVEEEETCIAFNIHGHNHNNTTNNSYYHLNITQNVFGYVPLNLNEFIKSGYLKRVKDIHRITINNATERKDYV